jgi:hypothetical protein
MYSKHTIFPKAALCMLLAALATGCATSTTPALDVSHGGALRFTKEAQTLNPTAPTGNNQVLGIDGKAAVNTLERYQDSFKTPPKTFEVINGGSQSGQ